MFQKFLVMLGSEIFVKFITMIVEGFKKIAKEKQIEKDAEVKTNEIVKEKDAVTRAKRMRDNLTF